MNQALLNDVVNNVLPLLIKAFGQSIALPALAWLAKELVHFAVKRHVTFLLKWVGLNMSADEQANAQQLFNNYFNKVYPEIQKIWWLKWMSPDLAEKYVAEILHDWQMELQKQSK